MADEKTLRERLSEEVSEGFQKSTGVIVNNTREVLGDALGSLIDDVKNLAGGIFNVLKGTLNTITGSLFGTTEEKTLDEQKEQTGLLNSILNVFTRQEKQQAREFKRDGNPLIDAVIKLIGAAAGIIVGYLATALGPFKSLNVVLKPFLKDGFVFKLFAETLPNKFSLLKSLGVKLSGTFTKISTTFSNVIKAISQSKVFNFGVIIGKFLFWFRFLWDSLKTIFSEQSIRDKILGVSAQLIALIAEIPELILNGLLKLFGSEFRVDFGKEAIIDAVNRFSDWLFPNFTVPVLDFFTKDIPNYFRNFISMINPGNLFGGLDQNESVQNIKEIFSSVAKIPNRIKFWLEDKLNAIITKIPKFLLPKSLEGGFQFDRPTEPLITKPQLEFDRTTKPLITKPQLQPAHDGIENLNLSREPIPNNLQLQPLHDSNDEIKALRMETKLTNEKLDKLVMATERNGMSTDRINQTVIAQQTNQTTQTNNIPTMNESLNINVLNGAMQ